MKSVYICERRRLCTHEICSTKLTWTTFVCWSVILYLIFVCGYLDTRLVVNVQTCDITTDLGWRVVIRDVGE